MLSALRKYEGIARTLFKAQLVYRFDIALNMVFTVSRILLAYLLWGAIYEGRAQVSGFTFDQMLTYYVLSGLLSQLDMSDSMAGEIAGRIRGGTFSKYMVIPCNVVGYFGSQTLGAMLFYMGFNLLAAALWVLVFGLKLTLAASAPVVLAAVGICLLGLVFMMQFNAFLGMLAFVFQDIQLFLMIKDNIVKFVTGALIPLALLGAPIVAAMRWLPFYYVSYLPSMLLLGRETGQIALGFAKMAAWNLFFLALNPLLYGRLRVRYDGVGI